MPPEVNKPPVTPTPPVAPPGAPASGPARKTKLALDPKLTIARLIEIKMAAGLTRAQAIDVIEAQRREDPDSVPKGPIPASPSNPAKLPKDVQAKMAAGLSYEQALEVIKAQQSEDKNPPWPKPIKKN